MTRRIAHAAQIVAVVLPLALVPAALAGKPGSKPGGGGGGGCTRNSPGVSVDNTWAWGAWGSWGQPGQQLTYSVAVRNYDVGCSKSSFVVTVSAPSGFSVTLPTDTISLNAESTGYLHAYVTSPSGAADGDYPLTVTVARAVTSSPTGSFATYYKLYSTDTTAPTLFWPSPGDGETLSGSSYNVMVSSSDDHAVKNIDIYIDGSYKATTLCDDISYTCQAVYKWSLSGVHGTHTATFKSYDWMGNVGALTTTFSVG
jgi:Bacterial Ig domain/NPCBM-associated, NEW3 domain of alpha-galactosidase